MRFRLHWRWSRGAGGRASPPGGGGWCQKTLLPMYLTIPVTSATSERKFFALRRLNNNLRSTMKQDRLNTCMPTDVLSQIHYGDTRHCEYCLCQRTTQRAWVGVYVWLGRIWAPPRFKTLRLLWRPTELSLKAIYNFELTNLLKCRGLHCFLTGLKFYRQSEKSRIRRNVSDNWAMSAALWTLRYGVSHSSNASVNPQILLTVTTF